MDQELVDAERAGANSFAVQLTYRLKRQEVNPYPVDDPRHAAYHRGYEMERLMRVPFQPTRS